MTTSIERERTMGSILLIHGSAPFDQDGNVPDKRAGRYQKTNFYLDLASSLEKKGWRVLRYSKPGVGTQNVNFDEYMRTDLSVIGKQLNELWNQMPNDKPRIVFAWSEGSLHVHLLPMQEIDGVVILGGISTNIKEVILSQSRSIQERQNIENELTQVSAMPRDSMLGLDRPVGRLLDELKMHDNWSYFVDFPSTKILILHGGADQEVPVSQADIWKQHLTKNRVKIVIDKDLNHAFGVNVGHGAIAIADAISLWWKD